MVEMLTIDGSEGEGGGQVLRSALALALLTGQPFRIENIRAGRKKPGLMRQHLTAVKAAATIGRAELPELRLRASDLEFRPRDVVPGDYTFSVGSAGSACLVLQAVLPPLLVAGGPSRLILEGGTHTTFAPCYDFLARVYLPLLRRMGAGVRSQLERPGFIPAGGGRFQVDVIPTARPKQLELLQRGRLVSQKAVACVAHIPREVAEREVSAIRKKLSWSEQETEVVELKDSSGPGNVVMLEIESEGVTEMFTTVGERGVRAETVGKRAAGRAAQYLASEAPVGLHLADQLMIPMAMAGAGRFLTTELTEHARTNMKVIEKFLPVRFEAIERTAKEVLVEVVPR